MAYLASEMADVDVYERLCYVEYENKASAGIPVITSITKDSNFDAFLSYDSTTKKFTVLQDFDAVIVPWVYSYNTASGSYSEGQFLINDVVQVWFAGRTKSKGDIAGQPFAVHLSANDVIWSYTPNSNGYPSQRLKIYRSLLPIDNLPSAMTLSA